MGHPWVFSSFRVSSSSDYPSRSPSRVSRSEAQTCPYMYQRFATAHLNVSSGFQWKRGATTLTPKTKLPMGLTRKHLDFGLQARILERFAIPSCWPRDWTLVFCIAGRFFTNWPTREAKGKSYTIFKHWQLSVQNSQNKEGMIIALVIQALRNE